MARFYKPATAITMLLLLFFCVSCNAAHPGISSESPTTAATQTPTPSPSEDPEYYPESSDAPYEQFTAVFDHVDSPDPDTYTPTTVPAPESTTPEPTATPVPSTVPATVPTQTPVTASVPASVPTPELIPTSTPELTVPNELQIEVETKRGTASVSGTSLPEEVLKLIELISSEREAAGLPTLEYDSALDDTALIRVAEITIEWSHTRPNGQSWSSVSSKINGENLAYGFNTPGDVLTAWMNSDGHRDLILNADFTRMGAAAFNVNGTIYWVSHFGY